jgi:hypothetical protein
MKAGRCAIPLIAFFCLSAIVSSANAEIRVKIDIPFVNDPQVNRTRVSVGFVANPDDFAHWRCNEVGKRPLGSQGGFSSPFFTWAYRWRTGGILA